MVLISPSFDPIWLLAHGFSRTGAGGVKIDARGPAVQEFWLLIARFMSELRRAAAGPRGGVTYVASGIDAPERAKARGAMRNLVSSAEGPRLRRAWRPISARGLIRAGLGVCGVALALAMLGALAAFYLLARGPISLESLKPRIASSLEEKLGGKYKVSIGPTNLEPRSQRPRAPLRRHTDQRSRRPHRRRRAGRAGRPGFPVAARPGRESPTARARRPRAQAARSSRRYAHGCSGACHGSRDDRSCPAALHARAGRPPRAPTPRRWRSARSTRWRARARPSIMSRSPTAISRSRTRPSAPRTVYEGFTVAFDKSANAAAFSASARGPSGLRSVVAKANSGADRSISIDAKDLSFDDFHLFDSRKAPVEMDMPVSFKFDAKLTPEGAMKSLRAGSAWGPAISALTIPTPSRRWSTRRRAASTGTPKRGDTTSTRSRRSRAQVISGSMAGSRRPRATSLPGALISTPATRFSPASARANCR